MNEKFFRPLAFYLQQWTHAHAEFDTTSGAQLQDAFHQALATLDAEIATHATPLRVRDGELLLGASPLWAAKLRHQHATLLQHLKCPGSTWEKHFADVREIRILVQPQSQLHTEPESVPE